MIYNYSDALKAVLAALKAKDHNLYSHSLKVAAIAVELASNTQVGGSTQLQDIHIAGLIHDVGKLYVGDTILQKDNSLTEREWETIHQHPAWGADFVSSIPSLGIYSIYIHQHHERLNGKGYPNKLTADKIHPVSQLLSVADRFAAVTEDRPYRRGMSNAVAVEELREDIEQIFGRSAGKVIDILVRMSRDDERPRSSVSASPYQFAYLG